MAVPSQKGPKQTRLEMALRPIPTVWGAKDRVRLVPSVAPDSTARLSNLHTTPFLLRFT
jgi:hypothetical protein